MGKTPTNAVILWLATALSIMGFVAGFNVVVDPLGYFGRNTIGYYFSSERQFKFSIVQNHDYNAILLGDSRVAYTDTSAIGRPDYVFINAGIAAASFPEQVALLSQSRLDRLKLAVFGLRYRDLAYCSNTETPEEVVTAPKEYGSWDALRYAVSWAEFTYSLEALVERAKGQTPRYHADGTRSASTEYFAEALLDGKTGDYWRLIDRELAQEPRDLPNAELNAKCRELLATVRGLADRYGFGLVLVFLPTNSDVLKQRNWETPEAQSRISTFLAKVQEVVPHVVDLSNSSFSDSANFWLEDSMHFKPPIGARVVQEAINRSLGTQARK